ncbi:MAG: hypothetical protein GY844_12035, partial [Bradyrhizobium sp.]|nr:hypothetical protein [Bradyrhizobium sp.]
QGSRPLIEDTQGLTLLEVVAQEILQNKITIESPSGGESNETWRLKM